MNILDHIKNKKGKALSIEVEPPRIGYSREDIFNTIDPLIDLGLSYVNITYHAARIVDYIDKERREQPLFQRLHPGTSGIAGAILERYSKHKIFPVPHIICTGFSSYDTEDFLHELACLGVNNILALRGDGSRDEKGSFLPFCPAPGGHRHAYELMQQIENMRHGEYIGAKIGEAVEFTIGGACYPEGHPDTQNADREIDYLKTKIDKGAGYFVSQMFFDCRAYETFLEKVAKAGITQPIIPGLKPIGCYNHLNILSKMFYCHIPEVLRTRIEKHKDDKEGIQQIGIDWCLSQITELRKMGAPSLHFYASRKARIKEIFQSLAS